MAYSDKEKAFYVAKMWSEGLTPGEAASLWGRPCRRSLEEWERAAARGELDAVRTAAPHACEHEKHARYPAETKAEALRLYAAGRRPSQVARMLGLPSGAVVGAWARAEREAGRAPDPAPPAPADSARVAALERELAEARLEADVLRAVLDDPKAGGLASLSNRQKVELGERLRTGYGFSLARVTALLGLSRSTYYDNRRAIAEGRPARGRDAREGRDGLDAQVAAAFAASGGEYGYRRLCAALAAAGTPASEREVRDSVRRQGLVARCGRTARRWSSYGGETAPAPPNLLLGPRGRHLFSAPAPNLSWATDITEMRAADGTKVYVSVVVDMFDQRVVAVRTSRHPDSALADSMLLDALATLPEGAPAPIVHSDRGVHYRAGGWVATCEEAGVVRSMSRKGCSPDNAACEGFFGQLKAGMYHGLGEFAGPSELEAEVVRWCEWYNKGRLKSFGGDRRPCAYETIDGRRERLGVAIP